METQFEMFLQDVEYTGDWRTQKAEEYPDDERNVWSAEALEYLHSWLKDGKDPMIRKLSDALENLFSRANDEPGSDWVHEMHDQNVLGRFGFDGFPNEADARDEECRELLSNIMGMIENCISQYPDAVTPIE